MARVTSGLWPHTQGTVAVPTPQGSAVPGLRDVFVVPQRLHMFTGSLADQVTYPTAIPAAERTVEQEEHLQQLLDTVGIGYLVRRWAGDREDREDTSLGLRGQVGRRPQPWGTAAALRGAHALSQAHVHRAG